MSIEKVLRITIDGKGAKTGAHEVNQSLQSIRLAVRKTENAFDNLKNKLFNFKTALLGLGLGAFAQQVITLSDSFQRYRMTLETLEKTHSDAVKRWDQLVQFAKDTPFRIGEVVDAYKTLKAYGIDPNIEAMEAFGNTAAIFGRDVLPRLALALGQMQAVGKVMTQDLNQLSNAGINVNEVLKENFNITKGELDKLNAAIEEGVLNIHDVYQAFISYMQDHFGGQMERVMNTIGGQFEILRSNIEILEDRFMQAGTTNTLVDILKEINNTIESIDQNTIDEIADSFANLIENGFDWFVTHQNELKNILDFTVDSLVSLGSTVGDLAGLASTLTDIASSISEVGDSLPKAVMDATWGGILVRWLFGSTNLGLLYATLKLAKDISNLDWSEMFGLTKGTKHFLGEVYQGLKQLDDDITNYLDRTFDDFVGRERKKALSITELFKHDDTIDLILKYGKPVDDLNKSLDETSEKAKKASLDVSKFGDKTAKELEKAISKYEAYLRKYSAIVIESQPDTLDKRLQLVDVWLDNELSALEEFFNKANLTIDQENELIQGALDAYAAKRNRVFEDWGKVQKQAAEETVKIWNHAYERISDMFADWIVSNKIDLDNFFDWFKKSIAQMVATRIVHGVGGWLGLPGLGSSTSNVPIGISTLDFNTFAYKAFHFGKTSSQVIDYTGYGIEATSESELSSMAASNLWGSAASSILSGVLTYISTKDWTQTISTSIGSGAGYLVGAELGSVGGPIGAAVGSILGGIAGSLLKKKPDDADLHVLFGDPNKSRRDFDQFVGEWHKEFLAGDRSIGDILAVNIRKGDSISESQARELESGLVSYFETMFDVIDNTLKTSVEETVRKSGIGYGIHINKWEKYLKDGNLDKTIQELTKDFFNVYGKVISDEILKSDTGDLFTGESLVKLQRSGELLGDTFVRVISLLQSIPDGLEKLRKLMEEGYIEADAIDKLTKEHDFITSFLSQPILSALQAWISNPENATQAFSISLKTQIGAAISNIIMQTLKDSLISSFESNAWNQIVGIQDIIKGFIEGSVSSSDLTNYLTPIINVISGQTGELTEKWKQLYDILSDLGLVTDPAIEGIDKLKTSVESLADSFGYTKDEIRTLTEFNEKYNTSFDVNSFKSFISWLNSLDNTSWESIARKMKDVGISVNEFSNDISNVGDSIKRTTDIIRQAVDDIRSIDIRYQTIGMSRTQEIQYRASLLAQKYGGTSLPLDYNQWKQFGATVAQIVSEQYGGDANAWAQSIGRPLEEIVKDYEEWGRLIVEYKEAQQSATRATRTHTRSVRRATKAINRWASIYESLTNKISGLAYSEASPLSAKERLSLLWSDYQKMLGQLQSGGLGGKPLEDLILKMSDTLDKYLTLGQQVYQRPSEEYQKIYNTVLKQYEVLKDFVARVGNIRHYQSGASYITHDQLAVLHRGEKVVEAHKSPTTININLKVSGGTNNIEDAIIRSIRVGRIRKVIQEELR